MPARLPPISATLGAIAILRQGEKVEWCDFDKDMGTQPLWVITAEILVKPGDLDSRDTKGFTNIVTWADSPQTAQQKVSEVLKSYGWEVLGIEAARRFDDSRSYDDDILDIVDQARTNPNACIIGTVFSYKPE
jgi:hypothetical protein